MASDVSGYLTQILEATYGEQVRGAIHDSIYWMHDDIENAESSLNQAKDDANTAANNANSKATLANTAATRATNAAVSAESAAGQANTAITNLSGAAANAAEKAEQAEAIIDDVTNRLTELNSYVDQTIEPAMTSVENAVSSISQYADRIETAIDLVTEKAADAETQANAAYSASVDTQLALTDLQTLLNDTITPAIENVNEKTAEAATQIEIAEARIVEIDQVLINADDVINRADSAANSAESAATAANEQVSSLSQLKSDVQSTVRSANDAILAVGSLNDSVTNLITTANATITDTENARRNAIAASSMITGLTVTSLEGDNVAATLYNDGGHWNIHFTLGRGRDGRDFKISGAAYPTLEDLEDEVTNPSEGDVYNVGTEPPYHLYRFTGTYWEDQGTIGVSFSALSNSDIDNLWSGNALSGNQLKFLDSNGLSHIISNNLADELNSKVDVETGKGLSTNDFTTEYMNQITANASAVDTLGRTKVSVDGNKVLSDENFTTANRLKLEGIETGANLTVVDDDFDSASSNPVQNSVITNAIDGVNSDISSLSLSLAPEYDPVNGTYIVGQCCVYNNKLYKATSNIISAEAWDSRHWTETSVTDELNTIGGGNTDSLSAKIDLLEKDFAANFSSSTTYHIGDYCTYNGVLYKRIANDGDRSTWFAEDWAAVTVVNEFNNYIAKTGGVTSGNVTVGQGSSASSEMQMKVNGKAGSIYLYSQNSTTGSRGLYGTNASGTNVSILTVDKDNKITLNGNCSGTSSNVTGTVATSHGGTGQTSVDTTPTTGSAKMCTSGGIYNALGTKLNLTGGTLTGDLTIAKAGESLIYLKNNSLTIGGTSTTTSAGVLYFRDSANANLGYLFARYTNTHISEIRLTANNKVPQDGGGTSNTTNVLALGVTEEGDRTVTISSTLPWLTAFKLYRTKSTPTKATTLPDGVTACTATVYHTGYVVSINLSVSTSARLSGWTASIYTALPKPASGSDIYFAIPAFNTAYTSAIQARITSAGALQFRYGGNANYYDTITYIASTLPT